MASGGYVRGVLTTAVGLVAGYAAAAQKPIPMSVQAPFIGLTSAVSIATFLTELSSVPKMWTVSFIAPISVGVAYGCGYYAGKIVRYAIDDGVFGPPTRLA